MNACRRPNTFATIPFTIGAVAPAPRVRAQSAHALAAPARSSRRSSGTRGEQHLPCPEPRRGPAAAAA